MSPLRFLCLHGVGTSSEIFQAQLASLVRELSKDNSVEFVFIDGELNSDPGPGVSGFFEPPYYSYYKWPRSLRNAEEDDKTVEAAYELIYETLEDEGPFTGLLGFSQGATLAFGFLVNHAKTRPLEPIHNLVRCAIFICSLPPFRQVESGASDDNDDNNCDSWSQQQLIFDDDIDGYLELPTLTIAGRTDFVYEHSLKLAKLCNPGPAQLLVHDKGHEVPADARNVREMAAAIRSLSQRALLLF